MSSSTNDRLFKKALADILVRHPQPKRGGAFVWVAPIRFGDDPAWMFGSRVFVASSIGTGASDGNSRVRFSPPLPTDCLRGQLHHLRTEWLGAVIVAVQR